MDLVRTKCDLDACPFVLWKFDQMDESRSMEKDKTTQRMATIQFMDHEANEDEKCRHPVQGVHDNGTPPAQLTDYAGNSCVFWPQWHFNYA